MKSIIAIAILIFAISTADAQGFFGAVKKPKALTPAQMRSGTMMSAAEMEATATSKTEFRPAVNMVSYVIGKDVREASIITGAGLSVQRLKYNSSTEKWNILVSLNLLAYGRVALGDQSNGKKFMAGISLGFFDNLVMAGYATDLSGSYGTLGVGIPLNNL